MNNKNIADHHGPDSSGGPVWKNFAEGFAAPQIILVAVCLVLAILCFTVGAAKFGSPERYKGTIESLDKKRSDVLELTAAATGTSVLITAVPGDTATPIAEKFADMIQWFLLVLCAIYLEKYMVTVMGTVAFRFLFPGALILIAAGILLDRHRLRKTGRKVLAFALILFLLIPASTFVTDIIERTYSYSIDGALESVESVQEDLEGLTGSEGKEEAQNPQAAPQGGNSLWDTLTGIPSGLAEAAGDAVSTLSDFAELPGVLVEKLQTALNQFIESLAYMLITSCVIPILVLIFFVFIVRIVFDGLFGHSRFADK